MILNDQIDRFMFGRLQDGRLGCIKLFVKPNAEDFIVRRDFHASDRCLVDFLQDLGSFRQQLLVGYYARVDYPLSTSHVGSHDHVVVDGFIFT